MKQYIDKDALVAEIERIKKEECPIDTYEGRNKLFYVVDYVGEIDHDSLYAFGGNTLYEAIEKAWNWLRKNSTGG